MLLKHKPENKRNKYIRALKRTWDRSSFQEIRPYPPGSGKEQQLSINA
jgi:hypothetical protein